MIQLLISFNGYGLSKKRKTSSYMNKKNSKHIVNKLSAPLQQWKNMASKMKVESSIKWLHDNFKGSYHNKFSPLSLSLRRTVSFYIELKQERN